MRLANSITLWRNRDFLKLWIGQTVSELGSRITREGLPITAVRVLHAAPSRMGWLSAISGAATLLFGLSAGVWGDRLRRRPILIATDLGRAAVLCLVPLAAAWHVLSMPHLCVVAALAGALTVFFDVAYQSYLPSLVERDRISEGNSKLTLSITGAEIAGPPLTGILVQLLTAPLAILLDAISFVFSAGMVWWIRTPENPPEPRQTKGESMWSETLSGLHFVAASPPLRALALRSVTAYFFFGFLATLYVLYALDVLKLSTAELGFTIAAGGVGGVLGSLFSERVVRRLGLGRTFVITALLHGCAAMLIPMARPPTSFAITLLTAGQLFGDCGFAIYMINETSLRQKMAPPAVLGRVNAAMQLASRGMLPLGALLGGTLADSLGVRPVLVIAAAGIILATGWLFQPGLWKYSDRTSGML